MKLPSFASRIPFKTLPLKQVWNLVRKEEDQSSFSRKHMLPLGFLCSGRARHGDQEGRTGKQITREGPDEHGQRTLSVEGAGKWAEMRAALCSSQRGTASPRISLLLKGGSLPWGRQTELGYKRGVTLCSPRSTLPPSRLGSRHQPGSQGGGQPVPRAAASEALSSRRCSVAFLASSQSFSHGRRPYRPQQAYGAAVMLSRQLEGRVHGHYIPSCKVFDTRVPVCALRGRKLSIRGVIAAATYVYRVCV